MPLGDRPVESHEFTELTPMQLRVLKIVCEGKKSREVADELYIGKRTVDFHLQGAYRKLNVTNRVQAFVRARELGLF